MNIEILKPCPFCGSKLIRLEEIPERFPDAFVITCISCFAEVSGWSRETVIEHWNWRVDNED